MRYALALAGLAFLLSGCATMTKPIDVTPALIDALGKDPASACMVNQGKVDSLMYGTGGATSTFCRTNVPQGALSVDRNGVITITHGPQTTPAPTVNLPVTITPAPGMTFGQ